MQTIYEKVVDEFLKLLEHIEKDSYENHNTLKKLIKFIIEKKANIVTFNYDTLVDKELFEMSLSTSPQKFTTRDVKKNAVIQDDNPNSYVIPWTPMRGYGFPMQPIDYLIDGTIPAYYKSEIKLLKLHGSMNWFVKNGSSKPYSIDDYVHSERWFPEKKFKDPDLFRVTESYPIIVPPTLDKSILNQYPIIKLVWSLAFEKLQRAKTIIFIGYSMPITDIAARFLFSETLKDDHGKNIIIVSREKKEEDKPEFENKYKLVSGTTPINFYYDGTLKWIEENF